MKIVYMKTPAQRAELDEIESFTKKLILSDIRKLYRKNKQRLIELGMSETEFFQEMKKVLIDQNGRPRLH